MTIVDVFFNLLANKKESEMLFEYYSHKYSSQKILELKIG